MNQNVESPWEPLPTMWPHPPEPSKPDWLRVVGRGALIGLLTAVSMLLLGCLIGLGVYAYYARTLPSPEELYERATPFKSTKIMDRNGTLLFEVFDPLGGKRTIVSYTDIPDIVIQAFVATEDKTFFVNPGVNPVSIVRALYKDLRAREVVGGGSTITQQLVKNLYLTPERTVKRKVQEAILAAEITRRYSKAEILEVYLNEIYLGNLAYGIGAAAETYFGKSVSELTLPEAALLAGLPQSPAGYDPYLHPEAALARRKTVLRLMAEAGYITAAEARVAGAEPLELEAQRSEILAPHLVMQVREDLERLYGPEVLYKGGLRVYTTLDLGLQQVAEEVVREGVVQVVGRGATNAALVALDPYSGDVLAMVGSADFFDVEIAGQVNVAMRPRQPGSVLKPFTYLAAMERGWTAASMVFDVEQEFPDGANPPYRPRNYDLGEYGPISVRSALACSRNPPAVSTLFQIGVPALLEMVERLGIHSLSGGGYGLSLTLGGGDVTLLELTGAYGALANGGYRVEPRMIRYIEDQEGRVLLGDEEPERDRVVDGRLAYIITDILADDESRSRAFGRGSVLEMGFPVAAKTGTTDDYRDGWTVGYTPDFVTGVWVGNSDGTPTNGLLGVQGAGPIWHTFMERVLGGSERRGFVRPEGIVEVEVCPVSGLLRRDDCPPGRTELFAADAAPSVPCTVHIRLKICQVSGKLAIDACPPDVVIEHLYEDYGPEWDHVLEEQGKEIPPREECPVHGAQRGVHLESPGDEVSGVVELRGSAEVDGFRYYVVEYGEGRSPIGWGAVTSQVTMPVAGGVLAQWDTRGLKTGIYTLRLLVTNYQDEVYESRVLVLVEEVKKPEATPTTTDVPTVVPTEQPPEVPTETPLPTATYEPTEEPAPEPTVTEAPPVEPEQSPVPIKPEEPAEPSESIPESSEGAG